MRSSRMAKEDIIEHQFTSEQSRTEAAKNGRKGGKASGKSRRDKRNFRDTIACLLEMPMKTKAGEPMISPITGKPMSIREMIVTTALQGAIKGNVKQLNTILDVLGEKATIVKNELSGQLKIDDHTIDLDKLTDEQRAAILSIGEDLLRKKEMEG